MTVQDATLLDQFIVESRELLEQAEKWLMSLEAPADELVPESVQNLFRVIHSIKGSANFLGLSNIGEVSHRCESLLAEVRDGRLEVNAPLLEVLLRATDLLRALVEDAAFSDESDVSDVLDELRSQLLEPGATRQVPASQEENADVARAPAAATMRVKATVLDEMLKAAGELVTARNRLHRDLSQLAGGREHAEPALEQMDGAMAQIQSQIMRARLEPLTGLLERFRRVVRDLAASQGKQVELQFSGDAIEIDRGVLEVVSDNLIHLLRNCVDHGIEPEEERMRAGKSRVGIIRIEARTGAESVTIDVSDDGAGIDVDRLRSVAKERGDWSDHWTDEIDAGRLMDLISKPGLSTASEISGLSGRGVGLDVVKSNVQRLGGAIAVSSDRKVGTEFHLRLPMTVLIVPSLIVEERGCFFAVPRQFVHKVCRRIEAEESVRRVGDSMVLTEAGHLVPLLRLGDLLQIEPTDTARDLQRRYIVIVAVEASWMGLQVDGVVDHEQAIVSKLSPLVASAGCYTGATVLGDGSIAMILDPERLFDLAGIRSPNMPSLNAHPGNDPSLNASDGGDRHDYLLCTLASGELCAVPSVAVRHVVRLGETAETWVGGRRYVRFEGNAVPLFFIGSAVSATGADDRVAYAILAEDSGLSVALGVVSVGEIVSATADVQPIDSGATHLVGTIDVNGQVAGVVNLRGVASTEMLNGGTL